MVRTKYFGLMWFLFRLPVRQLANSRRNVRFRGKLCHQFLNLSFRLVDGSSQNGLAVCFGEEWRQFVNAAQVEATVGKHCEKHRMLSGRTGDSHPKKGFVFRHMKNLGAVRKQTRSVWCIEPSLVNFGKVGDDLGLNGTRVLKKLRQSAEKIIIGNRFEIVCVPHDHNISAVSATALDTAG